MQSSENMLGFGCSRGGVVLVLVLCHKEELLAKEEQNKNDGANGG